MPFRAQHRRTSNYAFIASLLLLVIAVTFDLLLGDRQGMAVAYAIPPMIVACMSTVKRTALVALAAVSVQAVIGRCIDTAIPRDAAIIRFGFLVFGCSIAPYIAHVRCTYETKLQRLSAVAEIAQRAILTPIPDTAGPYRFATTYVSAAAESNIGGDLVGMVPGDQASHVIVGDVRGKGLGAVRLSALTLALFRETAASTDFPRSTVQAIENRLQPWMGVEDFVTAALASFGHDGTLTMVACGHPAPLVIRADGSLEMAPVTPDAPFGLFPDPDVTTMTLEPSDRVLFYTDGLIEARARQGGFVPLEDVTGSVRDDPFESVLDRVLHRLMKATGNRMGDDLAMLLVEYAPA